ncbi:cholesterol esterase, partial [Streptomyces sp. MBT57]|nr:cholesterol esterase [Streptomyces sp. MBT57]
MSSQVRGGTRWKRFALVMVPSVVATAAVGVGLAQGALAASFAVSGQSFKVRTDKLVGEDFVQYGSVAVGTDLEGNKAAHPVAVSGFS